MIFDREDHICYEDFCVCPLHGTWMHYSRLLDEHACQDSTCKYATSFEETLTNEFVEAYASRGWK